MAPFTYYLNNERKPSDRFLDLSIGSYQIRVEDARGCTAVLVAAVPNWGVKTDYNVGYTSCGGSSGSIIVNASLGEEPYTYSIDGEDFQENNFFDNLIPGVYEIRTRDSQDCSTTSLIRIKSDIAFEEVYSIIQTNCATPACHGGTQSPNLKLNAEIKANASNIVTAIQSGAMPPSTSEMELTQEEIDAIVCWVNDGANTN